MARAQSVRSMLTSIYCANGVPPDAPQYNCIDGSASEKNHTPFIATYIEHFELWTPWSSMRAPIISSNYLVICISFF